MVDDCKPAPIAVTGGALRGHLSPHDVNVVEYLGVPYAADPSGPNRFKPPQPVTPWTGVREAATVSAINYQQPPPPVYFNTLAGVPQSEDVLYLNVWAPPPSSHPKPVFMWIHGGNYVEGGNADPNYEGTALARKGVVVVVPNYRLGVLGFMAHPELSKENEYGASGNQGILDCIQALEWIRDNIAQFGGDPSCVTVGGQSAGALITSILIYSPLAKGLFHRGICQSGVRPPRDTHMINIAGSYRTLAEAEADGVAALAELGIHSLAEARACPAEQIAQLGAKRQTSLWGPPPLFRPVFDGHVLTRTYEANLLNGPASDIPLLVGNNKHESNVYAEPRFSMDDLRDCVRDRFGHAGQEWVDRFYETFSSDDSVPDNDPLAVWNLASSEYGRSILSLYARQWAEGARSPVYGYYFSHIPPQYHGFELDYTRPKMPGYTIHKGPHYGAAHGTETAYTFNSVSTSNLRPWTDEDRAVGERISNLWTNFITTGNPNGAAGGPWPSLTDDPHHLMELGGTWGLIEVARPQGYEFWQDYIMSRPTTY